MSDSRLVKGFQARLLELPEGLLVAVLYAAACWASRQVALDQLFLPAGIRIAALLVCRPSMWPYLALGEYAYFAQLRFPLMDKYGLEWVLISSTYQFPVAAIVVYAHRSSIVSKTDTWLLTVALVVASLVGLGNLALAHALWPSPPTGGFAEVASRYVIGHYMAILTIAPIALLWVRRHDIEWSSWRGRPTAYSAFSLLTLGALSALLPKDAMTERVIVQLLMAVPVIALTCLQGWWGAAIGMPIMSIFVRISTSVTGVPESFDLDSFRIQLLIAVAGTALLALGSQISHHYRQHVLQARAKREAISNARSSLCTGERELRNRVVSLRSIGDKLDVALSDTVDWMRAKGHYDVADSLLNVATVHSRQFREQTNMVYPTTMEHVGLYLALQVGGIGDAWEQTDRMAQPFLAGDPCRLSLDLQLTAYRALAEAVSLLLENEPGQLKIRARCGQVGSSRGILVTVGTLDSRRWLSRSTATMAIGRLSGRTQAYGGTVQCRRNRIRMFFRE